MKKLTKLAILIVFMLAMFSMAIADTVTVGTGTATSSYLPIYGGYGYTYSQQIYTQAQINKTGNITKLRFYYVSGSIATSKDWVIYMGHTTKTTFATTTDWEPLANLTQVFAGDVTSMVPLANNWMEITLTTPFNYNNTSNLIVAVDENTASYSTMSWGAFTSGSNTGIYYYSDTINPSPAAPGTASSRTASISRMQFAFPNTVAPLAPTLTLPANNGWSFTDGKLYWSPTAGGADANSYNVYFGTSSTPPLVSSAQTTASYTPTLAANTTYYWNVVASNEIGSSAASATWSFKTPSATQLAESFEPTSFPPSGWANPGTWSRSTSYFKDGVASAYKYGSSSTQYILSGPKCTITASSALNFWSTASSTTGTMQVVYSPDRVTWTQIGANITYTTAYAMINSNIDLSSLAGNNYYIGFRTGLVSAGYYVDSVFGPEITPEAPGPVALTAPADLATAQSNLPTLTWTAPTTGGVPTGYKIYCGPNADPTTYITTVTALTYTFTAPLTYNTLYYWKVVATNGTGDAIGSPVRSFTTMADPTISSLPFTEGFEAGNTNATNVSLWTQVLESGSYYWTANSSSTDYNRTPRTGTFNACLHYSGNAWMMRPVVLTGGQSYDVELYTRQDGATAANATMGIFYGSAPLVASMTNTIAAQTGIINGNYQRIYGSFTPATTGTYYLGIHGVINSSPWYISVDDIKISQTPAMPIFTLAPTTWDFGQLMINGTASKQFTITNTGGGTLNVSTIGISGTGFTLTANGAPAALTANQSATFTVQYAPTAVGTHSGTVTISDDRAQTLVTVNGSCIDPTITSFPYFQGFETVTVPAMPSGWTALDNNADGDKWISSTSNPRTGLNCARLYTDYNTANDDYLITPPIVLSGNQRLKFWTRAQSTSEADEISVLVSTTTPTAAAFTNVAMATTPVTLTTYTEYTVDLSAYTGTCYVSFTRNNTPADGYYLHVDDITIEDIPVTPILTLSPTTWDFGTKVINTVNTKQFTITNTGVGTLDLSTITISGSYYTLTANGAPASLTTNQSATFTVQYAPTAGGTHNGTVTINSNLAPVTVNLSAICVDPTIVVYPHLQNFDSVTTPALPLGWAAVINSTSTYVTVTTVASTPVSSPNNVQLYNSSDIAPIALTLASPPQGSAVNTLRAKFYARASTTGITLKVGTLNNTTSAATFTLKQTINLTTTNTLYSVDFASYAGTDTYIGFAYGTGGTYTYIYLDDVTFEHPAAIAPNTATYVTPTNGLVTLLNPMLIWTAPTTGEPATGYKVYLNTTGTFGAGDIVYTGTNTTYQVTGNAAGSTYYWKVVPFNATGDATGAATWSYMTPTATQVAESFELTTFPPSGWANPGSWSRSTSYPQNGVASAYIYGSSSTQYILSGPKCTITAASTLSFWTAASSTSGTMQIVSSPDRVTWTQVGTAVAYATTNTMTRSIVDLSSLAGNNLYIGFRTGLYGASYYVDSVIGPEITAERPDPVTQVAPLDAATGISTYPTLSWTSAATGGVPTGYKIYCGPNADPTTYITTVSTQTYTFTAPLTYSTLYYWKAVATNTTGDATGSTVRSFTTMADPTIYTFPTVQSFDDTVFPPFGWTNLATVGTYLWDRQTAGTYPTCAPNSGAGMIRYNSYSSTAGNKAVIVTPPLSLATGSYRVRFSMYRDPAYPGNAEYVNVYYNTANNLTGATLLGTINRDNALAPIEAAAGWYVYSFTLPAAAASHIGYVAFEAVSAYGNNMFIDDILVGLVPVGPPNHVTLTAPANAVTGLNPAAVTLSWTPSITGSPATKYQVFASTSVETLYESLYFETTNTSFNLSAQAGVNLGWNTRWYWATLPVNADLETPDIEAPEFMVWSFTTDTDPTIVTFPYTQNFDGVTTPNLPNYWTKVIVSTSTPTIATSTTTPVSSPNLIYMYNNADINPTAMRLVTPPIGVALNGVKTKFYARTGTAGQTLIVGTVDNATTSGTFTPFQTITLTTTNTQYTVSLATYVGTDTYIAFKHGGGTTYRSIYIDNFELLPLLNNDLAVSNLTGSLMAVAGTSYAYNATVTNTGLLSQSAYTVYLKKAVTNEVLASLPVSEALAPEASVVKTINWTPAAAGNYSIYAEVVLTGDMLAGNNTTSAMAVSVYSAGTYMPTIGNVASITTSNYTPVDVYWKNSVTDVIYTAAELQMRSGTVQAIVYQNNFAAAVSKPIKLWMKNTATANLTAGWLDYADYTLVYDGTVTFPIGVNAIVIPLSTPFAYTGGNLAVRAYGVYEESPIMNSANNFYYTASTQYPSRVRYQYADSSIYDPATFIGTLPVAGTLSNNVPNTMFIVDPAIPITTMPVPTGLAIVNAGANVNLTWTAAAGAYGYNVYAADSPTGFGTTPVATVYTNSYTTTGVAKKFYMVKTVSYRGGDNNNGLMLDPAKTLGIDNSKIIPITVEYSTRNKD